MKKKVILGVTLGLLFSTGAVINSEKAVKELKLSGIDVEVSLKDLRTAEQKLTKALANAEKTNVKGDSDRYSLDENKITKYRLENVFLSGKIDDINKVLKNIATNNDYVYDIEVFNSYSV